LRISKEYRNAEKHDRWSTGAFYLLPLTYCLLYSFNILYSAVRLSVHKKANGNVNVPLSWHRFPPLLGFPLPDNGETERGVKTIDDRERL